MGLKRQYQGSLRKYSWAQRMVLEVRKLPIPRVVSFRNDSQKYNYYEFFFIYYNKFVNITHWIDKKWSRSIIYIPEIKIYYPRFFLYRKSWKKNIFFSVQRKSKMNPIIKISSFPEREVPKDPSLHKYPSSW